ncbi:MAG: tRNA (adenosine(37)-N6)-threonylcarbamoyltransferase complex ATPase subunit type 1 TsaE [Brevinematia bacterium]
MAKVRILSDSEEKTKKIAREFAKSVKPGDIVLLIGDLGSGKTTFSKGFCSYFSVPEDNVTSPSFTIVSVYYGSLKIYHMDFYRIDQLDVVDSSNFLEYLEEEEAVKLIEWNKLEIEVPFRVFKVRINHIDEKTREIIIED